MDSNLYGIALFVHIVAAIALVGGSLWAHVAASLIPKAATVEGIRSQVRFLTVISKTGMPIALVVLAAGLYMAFAGSWWGSGWPVISLVLFAGAGAGAGAVLDPSVAKIAAALDETPDGPVTPELGAKLTNPKMMLTVWLMTGADLAIVFLMTNKPGWTGSLVAAALGLAFGLLMAARENRHAAAAPPAPAAPAA